MSYMSQQNQDNKYGQLARKLLKIATMSGSKVVFRRANQPMDTVTELLHELGTTDMAIGDVTAEVMLTTLGKIPSEMYYLEDTTFNTKLATSGSNLQQAPAYVRDIASTTVETIRSCNEHTSHSSVLIILLIIFLVMLLLCCISACLITKTKRRNNFFGSSDTECDPRCSGINQPLLDKISDCTNKTSISSLRN